jgi:cation diffusion facilitator CzcD-associated flavoprotein CzcO
LDSIVSVTTAGQRQEVIVIGAGPAGLAVRDALHRSGVRVRTLEQGEHSGARWSEHYDSVKLNSTRRISSLPGMQIPRRYGRWVRRDDFVEYLDLYAGRIDAPFEFGVSAQRLDRDADRWIVQTSVGERSAAAVVVATGIHGVANLPAWAGSGGFEGEVLHVTEYRNAAPYQGRDVLVVGTGASGHDIALDLVRGGAGRVRVSVRTPPILAPRRILGMSSAAITYATKHYLKAPTSVLDKASLATHRLFYRDAGRYLGTPTVGMMTAFAERGHGITMEVGLLAALRAGSVQAVAAVERLDGKDVVLSDGSRIQPDAVMLATGQRTGLESLVGHLGVLGPDERPLVHGGQALDHVPGLHFIGYRLPGGQLPDMRYDAPRIARTLSRFLDSA